jgi:hypothetical protein
MTRKQDEHYSEQEAVQRREAALKRMLSTPHKPHAESKLGKPRAKRAKKKQAKNVDR